MISTPQLDELFFNQTALDKKRTQAMISEALHGMDDGELFLEFCQSESLVFDDGRLRNANFDVSGGFGLRAVLGEATAYAHASELTETAMKKAALTVGAIKNGHTGTLALENKQGKQYPSLYSNDNPVLEGSFAEKTALLAKIDAYLRAKNPLVKQVSVSLSGQWQAVQILRAGGFISGDIRPLVRLNISVMVEKEGRMESGSCGVGGRKPYSVYINQPAWQAQADEALRQALVNLESIPAPAGEMSVVLGPGWPGILLHEAIGHGLEGDFNRKKTSAFAGLLGQRVAAEGVTVVDDGTLEGRRGSLNVDDEGTKTECTVLIEDGILKGYMQDRQNARLMGVKPTGNGRRESFACQPLPRMTNTYMLPGEQTPGDILRSVKKGLYAVNFGGGQVDITSGKFVFSASEAYLIENGEITRPVKGATLIGNGPDVLTRVTAIGNDMSLDPGVGTCGKAGQSVPVGVGQPTLLIDRLTVGGTEI